MTFILRTLTVIAALVFCSGNSFAGSVSFDLEKAGSVLQPAHLAGTCLPIWNNSTLYRQIQPGLAMSNYRLFRFPNGSLSNGYHWNGTGSYNADSIWECDSESCTPGFMSQTLWRGTSVSNWGFEGYSNITDGDTATWWRSDELISGTDPYFYLELAKADTVDSIVIIWGGRYAADFDIDIFTLNSCPYPGPFGHEDDLWETIDSVTDNDKGVYAAPISYGKAARYVRVNIKKFKEDEKSVEVKEVYLYSRGKQVSKNVDNYGSGTGAQTRVIAMPTFVGNTLRPGYATTKSWHFESFMEYIQAIDSASVPIITVNYGTGTPEEAAAWVHYANVVKKYNVRYWQVGNELDGSWEDGGPVTPKIYAEKFLLFSKAMKAVDPAIKVFGPLVSNAWFTEKNSGLYDDNNWLKAFIDIVGAAEKADSKKYCDGIDFHTYPYWEATLSLKGMLATVDDVVYGQLDSIRKWVDSSLAEPESVFVMMSEFNSSTVLSDLLQKPVNGLYVTNMYAGLAERYGSRAMSVFWDSFEEGGEGSNGTFGSLSLFNNVGTEYRSSLTKVPSAAYWALYAAQNLWIDPDGDNAVVSANIDSADGIRAYGIKTGDDFRVMMINFSQTAETVTCSASGADFNTVDVVTWGETQFTWRGKDANAYAFPGCGPSSRTIAAADLAELTLPGLSLCIVRYYDSTNADQTPRLLHLLSAKATGSVLKLPVCGTVDGSGSRITSVKYDFDSATTFSFAATSLDSGFDGVYECFADTISLEGFTPGTHKLYVRVENSAGKTSVDSVNFQISTLAAQNPLRKHNGNGWRIIEKKSGSKISLVIDAPSRSDRQVPLTARVIALNGVCVKSLTGKGSDSRVIEWAGESGVSGRAAPGVYFIVVAADRKVIYRTTVMIGE